MKKTSFFVILLFGLILMTTLLFNSAAGQSEMGSAYPPPGENEPTRIPTKTLDLPAAYPVPPTPEIGDNLSKEANLALLYLQDRYTLQKDSLVVLRETAVNFNLLEENYRSLKIANQNGSGKTFKLYVNTKTEEVFENIDHLRQLDDELRKEKYGKLSQQLHTRLQFMKTDETVTVSIWAYAKEGFSLPELEKMANEIMLERYPEILNNKNFSGKIFEVDDPEKAKQLEQEYNQLIDDQIVLRISPLESQLQALSYSIKVFEGSPFIFATLTKEQIITVSEMEDVELIEFADQKLTPEMGDTTMSLNVDPVWSSGIQGSGTNVVILESGNVHPNMPYLHIYPTALPGINGVTSHATDVATIAASYYWNYTGVAPSATILSIGYDNTMVGASDRLNWLYLRNSILRPYVINNSEGYQNSTNQLNDYDRSFDYWARKAQVLIVKSAGNSGGYITTPGLGWNVLTVGAANNKNTEDRSDDIMHPSSSYINPISDNLDREKPEVVAFGQHLDIFSYDEITNQFGVKPDSEGTSLAAPMVAGLSALLQNRNSDLQYWPEVQKAIIMASAINNIEGPSIIIDNYDSKDGAGCIDVGKADEVAQNKGLVGQTCSAPCWWGRDFTNSSFPIGGEINYFFNIPEPSIVRAAIVWWSNPDQTYYYDSLDVDLDLEIYDPNGNYLTSSWSYDNNFELVEFGAAPNGNYRLKVKRVSGNEVYNFLGVAISVIPHENKVFIPLAIK